MKNDIHVDYIIKNGTVVDPSRGINKKELIAVKSGYIVEIAENETPISKEEFDASGCIVTPGLIDFHSHFFFRSTFTGVDPDLAFISNGVTTAVDQGSSGIANCRNFIDNLSHYAIKSRIFLHVSAPGQSSIAYSPEPYVPEKWDRDMFRQAFEYGDGKICGLKMRASKNAVFDLGDKAFYESVKLAEDLNTKLVVHIPDPPILQSEIAQALRPGDVMSHMYHGKGNTIFENDRIAPKILEARKRGVLFDVAHGGVHLNYEIAKKAIEQEFLPDIISTDLILANYLKPEVYSLPYVMSQFLALGMRIYDIIKCVTETPAKAIGLDGRVGTLAPSTKADISIFKIKEGAIKFTNAFNESYEGNALFVPQAVIVDGNLMYKPLDSCVKRKNELNEWNI